MEWTKEAEQAVSRVPFFIRKRVRKRVEEEARSVGAGAVGLDHVEACRKRFLNQMEDEVKGFQVEECMGGSGCPNRASDEGAMAEALETLLAGKNLKAFLKDRVQGPLKLHHELRCSISHCPNACSRPQIVDIGLIGACRPRVSEAPCSGCGSCMAACREEAITLGDEAPFLDAEKCLSCGQCQKVCPTGTLEPHRRGYRVLVGGKLGRHPRLGTELGGIHSFQETLALVERCLAHYMRHNASGERLGDILNRTGCADLQGTSYL